MTREKRNRLGGRAAQVLGGVLVIALANVFVNAVVNAVALPHVDLPGLGSLPAIPDWLGSLLRWGKLIAIVVVIALAILAEETARRRSGDGDADDAAGGA